MPVLGGDALTLSDIRGRLDPNGKFAKIIEALEPTNEVLTDMGWMEGNLPTGHRTTIRTGLPTPTWRRFNEGVSPTKSTSSQVDFVCGMLEARIETDKKLADLGGNTAAVRASEVKAHMQGMSNQLATTLFYGDPVANPTTDIKKFTGLSYFYKSLTGSTSQNMISAGGSGSDNTSIWLVCWADTTIYGIYPKGFVAGLDHRDLGEADAFDSSNNRFRAYMDLLEWNCGLAVQDWRFAVRICNIDVSDLIANTANQQALINYMLRALNKLPSLSMGRLAFYVNPTVKTALDLGMRADVKAGGGLTYENVAGRPTMMFQGVPVRRCEAITETEATIS